MGIAKLLEPLTERVMLNEAEYRLRFAHCETCEHLQGEHDRCEQCGCFMRFKAQLRHASCPIGKW